MHTCPRGNWTPAASSGLAGILLVVPVILRNFLYLDERLTSQYLAQLEGGVYDEENQSATIGSNRGGEAGATAGPLSARGSRGKSAEEATSRTVRQTPEGNYRRLEKLLDAEDAMQFLDAFDDAIWDTLERGELLRIESQLKVSSVYQLGELAASAGPLMDLMGAFGEPVDRQTQEAVSGMTRINEVLKSVPVVAHAAGASKYKFICPLKREFLREELSALPGECVVVGALQRRLKQNERYSLLDAIGMSALPRAERRKAERDMKKGMPDTVVAAPAALIEPLALFR